MALKDEWVYRPTWQPQRIKWDHPELQQFLEDHYQDRSDEELAKIISRMTGINISKNKLNDKRLNMGLKREPSYDNFGDSRPEKAIDTDSVEIAKFIQARYKKMDDYEIAKSINERFDLDVTYRQVRRARLELGYKKSTRNPRGKRDISFSTPEKRDFIYNNHPKFRGDSDKLVVSFIEDFIDEFDPDEPPRSIRRALDKFVQSDISLNRRLDYSVHRVDSWRIRLFLEGS